MPEIRCAECGRRYQSRSGLRRHMKGVHGGVSPALTLPFLKGEGDAGGYGADPPGGFRLQEACAGLGIEWANVMSYAVYDDRVVVIEGPVGHKRVYMFPAGGPSLRSGGSSGRGPVAQEGGDERSGG